MSTENSSVEAALAELFANDVDGLLDAPEKPKPVTSIDRMERAFSEIVEFYRTHNRVPDADTRDISERKLGARLVGFLASEEKTQAVAHLDEFGLLKEKEPPANFDELLESDDLDLLDENEDIFDLSGLPELQRNNDDTDVAKREKAKDFEQFEPLFAAKHKEIAAGEYILEPFKGVSTIKAGRFFVLGGVMLFVAEVGETEMKNVGGRDRPKERLRVIFENGTESSMYRTSLAIRMGEQNGRAVVRANHTFDIAEIGDADIEAGHIYVLRSLSNDPQVASIPHLHKIGFSTGPVENRIAGASTDPTYLMADVEIVRDYQVYNVRVSKLESLIHRVFAEVRLDVTQIDATGKSYDPSEWFVVPIHIIDQAVEMIATGDITDFVYDKAAQEFRWIS